MFELRAQALDFLRVDTMRAVAECAIDLLERLVIRWMKHMRSRGVGRGFAAQLEFELPSLGWIGLINAMHFQRPHLRQRRRKLHRRFAWTFGRAWLHDGGYGRQANEVAPGKIDELTGSINP